MSNNKKRRLNPIAAANARRNKSLWTDPQTYAVLAIGTMLGVGIPSIAATNNAFPDPQAPTTTATKTTPNTANQGGVDVVRNNAFGATDGGTSGGVVAGGGNANGSGAQDAPGGAIVESDVISEATTCADPANPNGLKAAHSEVVKDRQELIVTTVNVDALFNMDPKDPENAAASGCFAAAQQILDLSVAIPSFPTSWADIGSMVTSQVTARLARMQQEILDKGCKIGLNALQNTLSPIQDVLSSANNSTLINDPAGFVGGYISKQIGDKFDAADLAFNGMLNGIDSQLKESNRAAREEADKIKQGLPTIDAPSGYDMGRIGNATNDGTNSILNGSLERAQTELNRVIAASPPKPLPSYKRNGNWYYPTEKNGQVTNVSENTYNSIAEQYNNYQPSIDSAQARVNAARQLITENSSGTGTVNARGNTPAPAPRSGFGYQAQAQAPTPTPTPQQQQQQQQQQAPTTTTTAPAPRPSAPAAAPAPQYAPTNAGNSANQSNPFS